ncbi:aspartate kinase [Caldimonas sp. KR1-144]|uniref:amino acid kinase family protein n=1 Tax=Caldimonas sp. KR1-144 TaxID=3400911 RepID=UPI003C0C46A8
MWVVKIGGSVARDPELLPLWLELLAEHGGGRVIVVPGGGAFADEVRAAQRSWGFDDRVAHNMAVLAMAQTAMLMQGLNPALQPALNEHQIRQTLRRLRPALWVPLELLRQTPDELTNWDVTSDSLAVWLAKRLNAERLIVVKSCEVPDEWQPDWPALADAGVIDRGFAGFACDAPFPIGLINKAELERMRSLLIEPAQAMQQ